MPTHIFFKIYKNNATESAWKATFKTVYQLHIYGNILGAVHQFKIARK